MTIRAVTFDGATSLSMTVSSTDGTVPLLIDINDPIIRAKFIQSNGNTAQYLGVNGRVPFDMPPQIYLWGNKDIFGYNLPGIFKKVPFDVTVDLDTSPVTSFEISGSLTTAIDDPFPTHTPPEAPPSVDPPVVAYLYFGTDPTANGDHSSTFNIFPLETPYLFASFWYKQKQQQGVLIRGLYQVAGNPILYSLEIRPDSLNISKGEANVGISSIRLMNATMPNNAYDGNWHNVMYYVDSSSFTAGEANVAMVYFDNQPSVLRLVGDYPWDGSGINYNDWAWSVGSFAGNPASVAELYVLTGKQLDINDVTIRQRFLSVVPIA